MKQRHIDLEQLSDLSYEITLWSNEASQIDIVSTMFKGCYKKGSAGSNDGRFIAAITSAAIAALQPSGLVLDFRLLEYNFGNTLLDAILCGHDKYDRWYIPTRIVTAEYSEDGIKSLLSFANLSSHEWISPSIEDALEKIILTISSD